MIKKHLSNVVILFSSLIGLSSVVVDRAFAQAWILQKSGSKYQELKAAVELAGKNWQDFLKDCSTQLRLHPKHIILEDIKKSTPKHQHDPENKDGKAKGSVEPMPDYMSRYNWTPERWAQARKNRVAKTPSSGPSVTTLRRKAPDWKPVYSMQEAGPSTGDHASGRQGFADGGVENMRKFIYDENYDPNSTINSTQIIKAKMSKEEWRRHEIERLRRETQSPQSFKGPTTPKQKSMRTTQKSLNSGRSYDPRYFVAPEEYRDGNLDEGDFAL